MSCGDGAKQPNAPVARDGYCSFGESGEACVGAIFEKCARQPPAQLRLPPHAGDLFASFNQEIRGFGDFFLRIATGLGIGSIDGPSGVAARQRPREKFNGFRRRETRLERSPAHVFGGDKLVKTGVRCVLADPADGASPVALRGEKFESRSDPAA